MAHYETAHGYLETWEVPTVRGGPAAGWYWMASRPGRSPRMGPRGPFQSEADAISNANTTPSEGTAAVRH